jgi:predicted MPP superfamily phosphohydrolase
LSGHTHGGQIKPLHILEAPYVWGLYQLKKTILYVSAGTGYWGPPMRLGTRAEITLLELVPSENANV